MSLLDLDQELGEGLAGQRRVEAHAALAVAIGRLPVGVWDTASRARDGRLGVLIVDGVLARDVLIEDQISTELLGTGDFVRPWAEEDVTRLTLHEIRWSVLAEARIAVLNSRLAAALAGFPEVEDALMERVDRRAQRLAMAKAIAQLHRVDRRLLALFWHLAERWGRVTGEGVVIPLRLSHRMIGDLIGARRPTVSTALRGLAHSGELLRRPDGTWLLAGEPVGVARPELRRFVPLRRDLVPSDQQ